MRGRELRLRYEKEKYTVHSALITIFTVLYDRAVERAIKRIPNCTSNWTYTRYRNSVACYWALCQHLETPPPHPACSCTPKFIVIFNRSSNATQFPFSFVWIRFGHICVSSAKPVHLRMKISLVTCTLPFWLARFPKLENFSCGGNDGSFWILYVLQSARYEAANTITSNKGTCCTCVYPY